MKFFILCFTMGVALIIFDEFYIQRQHSTLQQGKVLPATSPETRAKWPRYVAGAMMATGIIMMLVVRKKPAVG